MADRRVPRAYDECQYSPHAVATVSAFFTELHNEALLTVAGPDAEKFLQGQTTCDFREINSRCARAGAYCTPQGRMLADFVVLQQSPQSYLLRMRRDIVDATATVLGKYIVFSKAELNSADANWQLFACWGDVAASLLELLGGVPGSAYEVYSDAGFWLLQLDSEGQQFELYVDREQQPELAARLASQLQESALADWQALQIAAGNGRIEAGTVAEFLPQMLNYDRTGKVSFTKGCYTGQEVIARLHYRGQAKRRMHLAQWQDSGAGAAGLELYTAANSQSVGNLVNSVLRSGDTVVGLVVISETVLEQPVHLGSVDGPQLAFRELPYSLESN